MSTVQNFKNRVLNKLYGPAVSEDDEYHEEQEETDISPRDGTSSEVSLVAPSSALSETTQPTSDGSNLQNNEIEENRAKASKPEEMRSEKFPADSSDEDESGRRGKCRKKETEEDYQKKACPLRASQSLTSMVNTGLSKNKKRKLKKKRRERERKMEDKKTSDGTEFTFGDAASSSQDTQDSLDMWKESKKDEITPVLEFLEGLLDIYCTQKTFSNDDIQQRHDLSTLSTQVFLSKLKAELTSNSSKELDLLSSTVKTLLLQNKSQALEKINHFKVKSSLSPDLKEPVTQLYLFWTNEIMNS